MGVIDSFFVALGFKLDPESSRNVKKQVDDAKSSLMSLGTAIKGIATGFVVKEIAEIGSTFEQNRIQIAGYLSALGQSKDFDTGLNDAADVIRQITKDAAKLPGEAEEYIEVFKGGLPFVQGAMPGGSLKDMTDFTNQLTAIGKTFGLDAGLIAREFDHMLSPGKGTAGLRLPLFRQLLPFMQKASGQAHITAESFNAMTAPQRLQLLQKTFATLAPMLKESETSFDAMWGAAKSMLKTLVRVATSGIFVSIKDGLQVLSDLFVDADGKLTPLGQSIADVAGKVGVFITRTIRMVLLLTGTLLKFVKGSTAAKIGVVALAVAVMGLQKALTYGLIGALIVVAEDLYTFYEGGQSVTGLLVREFGPALYLIIGALGVLGIAFVAVQAQSVAAALTSAVAWALAAAPVFILIAALGFAALEIAKVIAKWDELKATAKGWWNIHRGKVLDALGESAPEGYTSNESAARLKMGHELDDIAYKKAGNLTPGAEGPAFRASDMSSAPSSKSASAAAQWQKWDPSMGGTQSHPVTNNVNVTNNITSPDGKTAGQTAARETVRALQKAHAY